MKPEIVEELARAIARHMTDDPDAKAIICDQKLAQALAPFIDRLVSEAREATEAAIVAWLYSRAACPGGCPKCQDRRQLAQQITSGAHRG